MKTKEELNALKEEVKALHKRLSELNEDELNQITGGTDTSAIIVDGIVVECLPNSSFRVELQNGYKIVAQYSSKIRMKDIEIFLGDSVKVEMSSYDLKVGKIIDRIN